VWIAVATAVLVTATPASAQMTRYVSPNGDDANTGTESQPFRTIQKAANVVNPGDTVIVEDGVYTGTGAGTSCASNSRPVVCLTRGGTPSAWVTIRARNVGGAQIDGQRNISTDGFRFIGGANYIRIEGFDVFGVGNANGSSSGFELYSAGHDVILRHNRIHDIGRLCTDTGNGEVAIFVEQPNVRIEGNEIHDIGRFMSGENGCTTSYTASRDHGIYANGSLTGPSILGAANITIVDNVFYNAVRGWAVQLYPGSLASPKILNNTFAFPNPYQDGQIILGANTTDAQIENNVFYNPRTAAINYYTGTQTNLRIADNMVWNAQLLTSTPSSAVVTSNKIGNPNLSNVLVRPFDFHLTPGSPAINAGVDLSDPVVDFDGAPRSDGAFDIGAFEYGAQSSVSVPTFTPNGGTFSAPATVALSTATAGATIHYTLNGSTPTSSAPVYVGPFTVSSTTTVNAMASMSGMVDSAIASATFTIATPTPTPSPTPTPTADTTAPTVSFAAPASGYVVPKTGNGSVNFAIAATDNVGVTKVLLLVDNQIVKTFTTGPYSASYSFKHAASGTKTIMAIAYDGAGNSAGTTIKIVVR
jgi:hypothetical protein